MGLQLIACLDYEFESHRRHGCLSVLSAVCCQVEVSASGWSLAQRSPTNLGVSEGDREFSITKRPCPTRVAASWLRNIKKWIQPSPIPLPACVFCVHVYKMGRNYSANFKIKLTELNVVFISKIKTIKSDYLYNFN